MSCKQELHKYKTIRSYKILKVLKKRLNLIILLLIPPKKKACINTARIYHKNPIFKNQIMKHLIVSNELIYP